MNNIIRKSFTNFFMLALLVLTILPIAVNATTITPTQVISDMIYAPTGRTATILVAASDSSDLMKYQADYVCTGTDDGVQIQAAIDALSTKGGKVYLAEGTYDISDSLILVSNMTLEGQGFSTVLKLSASTNKNVISCTSLDSVIIKNIKIDGNRAGNTPQSDTSIQNGIYLEEIYNAVVEDIVIENCEGSGIMIKPLTDSATSKLMYNSFSNIVSKNNTDSGVYITSYAEYMTFSNCHFVSNTKYGVCCLSANIAFTDCIMCENTGSGVGLIASSKTTNDVFTGCQINHNLEYGVRIVTAQYMTINSCKIIANGKHGILLYGADYCVVNGNSISTNSYDNAGYDNINLDSSAIDNIIANNQILMSGGLANYGINETSGDSNVIVGNSITAHTIDEISVTGSSTIVNDNIGYKTVNSGTANVTNGNTAIVVDHGLATTPTRIQVTPTNNPTNAVSFWYVNNATSTNFTINVNTDPGATGLAFDWRAVVGEGN